MGIGINRSGKKNILKSEWSEVIDWNVVYLEKQEVESLRFQSEKYLLPMPDINWSNFKMSVFF